MESILDIAPSFRIVIKRQTYLMPTESEKRSLLRAILNNSIDNNLDSWRHCPDAAVARIIVKFAKENPNFLVTSLLLQAKYGVFTAPKHFALLALSDNSRKVQIEKIAPKLFRDIDDIYGIIYESKFGFSAKSGMSLGRDLRTVLHGTFENISEKDLLPFFVEPTKREIMKLKLISQSLSPRSKDPSTVKLLRLAKKRTKKGELSEIDYPFLHSMLRIRKEEDASIVGSLLDRYAISPFRIFPWLRHKSEEVWLEIIPRMTSREVVEMLPSFPLQNCLSSETVSHLILETIAAGFSDNSQQDFPFFVNHSLEYMRNCPSRSLSQKIKNLLETQEYPLREPFKSKRVVIFLDVSSSMDLLVRRSDYFVSNFDLALSYAKILLKYYSKDLRRLVLFSDSLLPISMQQEAVRYEDVIQARPKGKSNVLIPLTKLLDAREIFDHIFIFTDYDFTEETLRQWKRYRQTVNKNAVFFLIQIMPFSFKRQTLPSGYHKMFGWNHKSINIIANVLNFEEYVEEIKM